MEIIKEKISKGGNMKTKHFSFKLFPFFFIIITIFFICIAFFESIETLSKYGSRGNEVTQIQTKLKRWGYYSRKY